MSSAPSTPDADSERSGRSRAGATRIYTHWFLLAVHFMTSARSVASRLDGGDWLDAPRGADARRIDISEVETRTKIRAKYLRAIENEEWDLLPGPIYIKSFLRTYGDFLGLDSRMLVDEYKRRYERPSDHELRPDRAARPRARARRQARDR